MTMPVLLPVENVKHDQQPSLSTKNILLMVFVAFKSMWIDALLRF